MAFQVSGLEPDFVSFGEQGEFPMVAGLQDLAREVMGSTGFVMSGSKRLKAVFHSGEVGVKDDGGKGTGSKPIMRKNGNLLVTEWG